MEESFSHGIDLSAVTHRHGQSPDLEPKRRRAWDRLDDRERRYIVGVYKKPVSGWDLPFVEVASGYERVLYVLVTTDVALSAEQIAYLMIARHYRNADITSIRKQLAIGVRQGHLRQVGHDRYGSTDDADEKIRLIEQRWRAARNAKRIARVTRAAQLAGLDAPDLSTGPPEMPETEETLPETPTEASLEERFPGMSGEYEGDSEGKPPMADSDAANDVGVPEPADAADTENPEDRPQSESR
ncbi:MAG: hypothetical protein QF554_11335 [Dehalococcoidia bacterium]|jgi:hypothetical protein|nr:hypothetical protein [Dehalococcoidia bacterium]